MDIIQTCETIELWINSCRTREQLELLEEKIFIFFARYRFPSLSFEELYAQQDILKDKIKFRKEQMLFTDKNQTLTTNTLTSGAANG